MNNFIRDNKWLWLLKGVACAFQVPATWDVFHDIFKEAGRPNIVVVFNTLFAILLIDALFLVVLFLLESGELTTLQKLPWALVGTGLIVATLEIGLKDEGSSAWMPRIGFIGLVSADLFSWITEFFGSIWHSYVGYYSFDKVERRLIDRQKKERREQKLRAWRVARNILDDELVQVEIRRERVLLGIDDVPVMIEQDTPLLPPPDYIIQNDDGYGYIHPVTGEEITVTQTGRSYTERGAKAAYRRALNHREEESAW